MKVGEVDILILPGVGNAGPEHWQSRWEKKLRTARRVEQINWGHAERDAWVAPVVTAVTEATRPVVLVAHSLGVLTAVAAAPLFPDGQVMGAFLVAVPDVDAPRIREVTAGFSPVSRDPLPFPSFLIASRNDPFCHFHVAEDYAYCWGSFLVDAGEVGHLNTESGHGPWPEGTLVFARFVARL